MHRTTLALVALVSATSSMFAQTLPKPEPDGSYYLTEAMWPTVLNLLKVSDVADSHIVEQNQQYAMAVSKRIEKLDQIRNGSRDALTLLKSQTSHIAVPPDFKYDAGCSQQLNQFGALFVSDVALDKDQMEKQPAYVHAVAFYKAAGWKRIMQKVAGPFPGETFTFAADSVAAFVYPFNELSGLRTCKAATGPAILLSADPGIELDKVVNSYGLNEALHAAGITSDDWNVIKDKLYQAYNDLHHPEDLQEAIASNPDRYDVKERNSNLAWYRKHASVLDPFESKNDH